MQCENIDVNASQVTFVLPGIEMTHRWCSLDTMGVRVGWQCCLGDDNDGEMSRTRSWCCRCFGDDNDGEVSGQGVGVALELPLPWR